MTGEPTSAQRAIASSNAQKLAKVILQSSQEQMLKTVFSGSQLKQLDKWITGQNDPAIDRPEAIRRLVDLGMKVKTPAAPVSKPGRRLRAQELAAQAIEKIIDPAAPPEERTRRRRHLTKGPLEFREDRVDLPKAKG